MAAGVRGAINSGETRPTATEGGGEGSSDRRGRNRLGHKATIIYRERCANVFHRRWKRRGRSIKPGPFVLAAFVLRFAPPAGYSSLLARRGSASNRRFILLESIARDVSRRRFFRSRFFFFEIFDRRSSSSLQLSDIRIVRPFNRHVGITSVTLEMLSKGRQNSYDAFRWLLSEEAIRFSTRVLLFIRYISNSMRQNC